MLQIREFIQRKDIGYVALFEPKDAQVVQKYMDLINIGRVQPEHLTKKFDRFYNDQTVTIHDKPFEPIQVAISGNKIVNEGLIALAEFAIGKRTKRFEYYAIGESDQGVSVRDDKLYDHHSRLRISDAGGTFIQRQSTIYYSLFFPKTTNDCTVRETGIFDSSSESNDKMLLRTVLPEQDQMKHIKNRTTIFVAHIIYSGSE